MTNEAANMFDTIFMAVDGLKDPSILSAAPLYTSTAPG